MGMKNTVLRIAIIVLALAAAISCRKQEEHPAYERTARIASYYGGMAGEGVFKVLNACVDGKWEQWPPINGLDYEEGYEYEVRVRFDYNRELEGMTDVMFPYSGTLLELVKKTECTTGDCPLPTYGEFEKEYFTDRYEYEGTARIASYTGQRAEGRDLFVHYNDTWHVWPIAWLTGLDYEEGYEYVIKVDANLISVTDGIPVCDNRCLEVISKTLKQTTDCPF